MKKAALLRDSQAPMSNRVRYVRWRLRQLEKKLDPKKVFPIEIYRSD